MPGLKTERENRLAGDGRRAGAALVGMLALVVTVTGSDAGATPPPPPEAYTAPATTVSPAVTDPASLPSTAPPVPEPRSFTIAATGDLLIHSPIVRRARSADGWDFTPMFRQVAPILRAADLAVCHVETPMSPDNKNLSTFPLFSVPNHLADAIAYAGYDTCSLASNHSLDSGMRGVVGTLEALERVGVAHTGVARSPEQRATLNLLNVNGATVAHLSYTYGLNTGELRTADAPPGQHHRRGGHPRGSRTGASLRSRLHPSFPALGNRVQANARPFPGRSRTTLAGLPRRRSDHRPPCPRGAAR